MDHKATDEIKAILAGLATSIGRLEQGQNRLYSEFVDNMATVKERFENYEAETKAMHAKLQMVVEALPGSDKFDIEIDGDGEEIEQPVPCPRPWSITVPAITGDVAEVDIEVDRDGEQTEQPPPCQSKQREETGWTTPTAHTEGALQQNERSSGSSGSASFTNLSKLQGGAQRSVAWQASRTQTATLKERMMNFSLFGASSDPHRLWGKLITKTGRNACALDDLSDKVHPRLNEEMMLHLLCDERVSLKYLDVFSTDFKPGLRELIGRFFPDCSDFSFRLSWETSTLKRYHPEDSEHSGSGGIEFSSKSTALLM